MKRIHGLFLALIILCFASYLVYGLYFNAFGTNADATMAFFGISESRLGLILTVASVGCVVMTIVLGLYGERINKIAGVCIGLGLLGVAGVLIGVIPVFTEPGSGYGLIMGFSLLGGTGYIIIDLLMNGVIADVYPEKKSTLLPFVHAFYGTGAMLAPLLVTALTDPSRPSSYAKPYLTLGAIALVICVSLAVVGARIRARTPYADMSAIRAKTAQNPAEVFCDGRAWLYFAACFLYLCFQTGISAWLPKYCMNILAIGFQDSARILTLYFLGALVMRFLSPLAYKKLSPKRFFILTLLVSAAIYLLFLLIPMPLHIVRVAMVVVGFLQGAAVPTLVILCTDAFPERSASASSIIELGVSLAALIAPAVMGAFIEKSGYLIPMLLIVACLPLSAAIVWIVGRMKTKC